MPAAAKTTTAENRSLGQRLLAVQVALNVPKSRKAQHYSYRNAEDILDAAKPLLEEHGIMINITDEIVLIGERYYIMSTVVAYLAENREEKLHIGQAFAREEFENRGMSPAQITGAASSYARKYALNGAFLIDDGRDDDEIRATAPPPRQQTPAQKPPAQTQQAPPARNQTQQAPLAAQVQAGRPTSGDGSEAPTREQWSKLANIQADMKITDRQEIRNIAANLFEKDEYLESMKTMSRSELSTLIDNLVGDLVDAQEPPLDIDDIPF